MPELPEAETIARSLRNAISGRTIVSAAFLAKRVSADDPARLAGRRIQTVVRHGKQVLLELDSGALHVKLGMTGAMLVNGVPGAYTRAVFNLDDGSRLQFDDIRQFGSLTLVEAPPERLGPDPLEITAAEFAAKLRSRRGRLKPLLLNQTFVRGLGNIYVDESLFRARLHPLAEASRITPKKAGELHAVVVEVLEEAITNRGSSVSDYVDAAGERGSFQTLHRVYGRKGQPCLRCGTPIQRIVVGQRGTHFCPRCQATGRPGRSVR